MRTLIAAVLAISATANAEQCVIEIELDRKHVENHSWAIFPKDAPMIAKCFDNGLCGVDLSGLKVVDKGKLEELGARAFLDLFGERR